MKAILIVLMVLSALCAEAKKKSKHKHMALKDDLAAFWNMEQDPRLFPVHDQSENGNHLTAHNSPVNVAGKVGDAIQFNGTNQWLDMASSAGISHQGTNEFTVCLWFKPIALGHQKTIATCGEWGASMILSGGNYYINVAIEDEDFNITDVPLVVGNWYFLTFGWYGIPNDSGLAPDGQFAWGSINLSDRVRELQSAFLTPAPGSFSVAGTAAIGWSNVVIDDLAIWRRNVSAEELHEIYNDGDGLDFSEWDAVDDCKEIKCCDD